MAPFPQPVPANNRVFPKSTSSPTVSSSSQTDSVSTWSSFSATTSHSSIPPPPPPPTAVVGAADKKIKLFGEGWLSNPSSQHLNLLPDPFTAAFPRRARSPSVPNLPSQLQPTPKRHDGKLSTLLEQMELASHRAPALSSQSSLGTPITSDTFTPYTVPTHPGKALQHRENYLSSEDQGHRRHLPTLIESSPMLAHHQSVPNLSSSPRLRHSGQVRFPDELDEGDDDYGHMEVMGYGGRKLSSKSMSELSNLPKGKNGKWLF
jgi:hypothetical protein